jgi:serine/arginine repetitive matrix protein 2
MIGGGHVRRRSITSLIDGSPCARVEKRAKTVVKGLSLADRLAATHEEKERSAGVSRFAQRASVICTASYKFGGARMDQARNGRIQRDSLELTCLSAEGEAAKEVAPSRKSNLVLVMVAYPDYSTVYESTEAPQGLALATRPRSATSSTTGTSGIDTPPLSAADSSVSGSESSIDVAHLNVLLANVAHPTTSLATARARVRGRGHAHTHWRMSQARMSRASVYETIEEEVSVAFTLNPPTSRLGAIASVTTSPAPASASADEDDTATIANLSIPATSNSGIEVTLASAVVSAIAEDTAQIVDSNTTSPRSSGDWDPQHGFSLRRYYALRSEAHDTVEESKTVWPDTAFSAFAVQGTSSSSSSSLEADCWAQRSTLRLTQTPCKPC